MAWRRGRRLLKVESRLGLDTVEAAGWLKQVDACGPTYRYDSPTRLVLERKEDMRRRGVRSPDEWDAVALTFAKPVAAAPPKPNNFNRKLVYPRLGIA